MVGWKDEEITRSSALRRNRGSRWPRKKKWLTWGWHRNRKLHHCIQLLSSCWETICSLFISLSVFLFSFNPPPITLKGWTTRFVIRLLQTLSDAANYFSLRSVLLFTNRLMLPISFSSRLALLLLVLLQRYLSRPPSLLPPGSDLWICHAPAAGSPVRLP